jgi:SpoIIAA-like
VNELTDMPPGVVGFETSGRVHARDYRNLVRPAVEKAAAQGDLRCVVVVEDFGGMTPGALWHDLAMGFEHLRAWKRIALVTDIWWIAHMAAIFGWASPGELKRFSRADRGEAIAWAADQSETADDPAPDRP